MIRKILVPVDQSKTSIKAANYAFEVAKQMNASIAFLCVMEINMLEINPDAGEFPDEKRLKIKTKFIELIKTLERKHPQLEVEKVFLTEGKVAEQIIKKATEWSADLIIMGSHGRTGLSHLLLGSTAEAVMRHGKIPVFIVPKD